MHRFWIAMTAAAGSAAVLTAGPATAATVLDVNWSSGCGAANCFNENGVFTQTWSAAGANGPMTIGRFLMDRGILGDLDDKTFSISFSVGGQELGSWGSYMMAGIGGEELNFDGLDFVWNPQDGDLVLTLTLKAPPKQGLGGGVASSPSEGGDAGGGFEPQGEPDQGALDLGPAPAAVPEPGAWALMIAGFGLAGAALRQRRRVTA